MASLDSSKRLAYGWLAYAVGSLIFAGIFALMVALARTPYIKDLLPGGDYFYIALVGHVILAVVIWFLAFEGFLWILTSAIDTSTPVRSPALGWLALFLSAGGTVLIVICALLGLGYPELANYVPVIIHPLFFTGLGLFAAGMTLILLNTFLTLGSALQRGAAFPIVTRGMAVAAVTVTVALVCFFLAGYLQYTRKGFFDFERFFWGGGHILQFANTISMAVAWLYLVKIILRKDAIGLKLGTAAFLFYLLFVLPAPLVYFVYDTASYEYKTIFTRLMQWGIGPPTAFFIISILYLLYRYRDKGLPWARPGFSSLVLSIAIFLLGGLIALDISGVNTKIPAHYHCAIGAVTIAFMGLFYEVIPFFGLRIYSEKMARIQPYLYGLGILLFATGLYIAGWYGAMRKVYGQDQAYENMGKLIGLGIMGVGGLVAIAGGIYFVLNALLTFLGNRRNT